MLAYKAELERIAPSVEWLMTLYLHPEVTPDEIRKAAKAGVKGRSFLSLCQWERLYPRLAPPLYASRSTDVPLHNSACPAIAPSTLSQ